NAGLWTVVDPVGGGSASVSAKALELDVPGGVDHDLWTEGNRSVRVMQAAPDADFEMEVKFESAVAQAFQLQGLVVEEDGGNYLRFNVQSEGTAGVVRLFAASVADGVPSARVSLNVASGATYYLRVGRAGDRWTFRHCYDGEAWTTAGTFDCVLAVGAVGVFAGNASGSASPAFTAVADYFFNTASPIEPEDGEPANAPPSVDAGPDRSLELPDAAILDGTVSDDGLPDPPGAVSVTWSVASGPAAVAFGDATAVDTTATFSSAGTYVLRLTASDGALSASDTMTVVVEDPPSLPENGRIAEGLIVFYAFDEGEGTIIHDISGVGETLDLSIADPSAVSWGTGTLAVNAPAGIISTGTAEKIHGAVTATNEITIEAWIAPANVVQDGPSRIVTMSEGPYSRNFTLGQGLWEGQAADVFDVRLRTTGTDANGQPSTTTASGTVQPALHHVAYSRDASGEVRLYVDGVTRILSQVGGTLSNWDPGYHLGLADEVGGGRPWSGTYHLLAIYDRALTEAEVARNLDEGPDAPPWGGETPTFVRGDPNADGAVDLGDAVFILQYIFGGPSPACRASLDIDADGVIDIGDAIRLLNYIFLGGPSPAPPFPGPPAPCP
ncbi:MAG: hypothetical protein JXP34_02390, partial [Planctomycetes bacterium]|nr:hypothetical protein [Planctomycetota bacterium]